MSQQDSSSAIHNLVREHYASIAEKQPNIQSNDTCACSVEPEGCCGPSNDLIDIRIEQIKGIYETEDVENLPSEVTNLSLGCGDPVTLANLRPGQTVLDLGAGGGIDCFLAARKVGPTGKVIGVDMTPAMLDRARANRSKLGLENVEFRLGEIEHLPVADSSVDVIISNCVINLSPDKAQVFSEAARVLRSGGMLAVSDIVTQGSLPESIKENMSAWAACVAGALDIQDYIQMLQSAGFTDVTVASQSISIDNSEETIEQLDIEKELGYSLGDGTVPRVLSARITAVKP